MDPDFTSLHQFLIHSAYKIHTPEKLFLFEKKDGVYSGISYADTFKAIEKICAFLYSEGIRKGDKVALILENCPEYIFFDQALLKIGAVNVSIYPTLTAEETAYILNDSDSKMLLLGNTFLHKKFLKIKTQCRGIRKRILMQTPSDLSDTEITFDSMLEKGDSLWPSLKTEIDAVLPTIGHDDLAGFIYTSGTTGIPKGVMLSHYNFMSNCYDALDLCPSINKNDRFLSFLPMSHVYERLATYFLSTYIGAEIAFAESIEKVSQNFQEAHPTVMACVPRLLERLEDRVQKNAHSGSKISASIFDWSLKIGERERHKREEGKSVGLFLKLEHALAEKLVFSKIKAKLGGRLKILISGGGALPQHIGEFFGNIGIRVQQGYGLTETSPFISVNEFHRQVHGTSGRVAPRQEVAIQNIETGKLLTVQTYNSFEPEFESGEGEILSKGPNIMKGYFNQPEETAAVIDKEGWFHTGDIGKFEKGYLKITDRLKNMLKTSLGKNIYPTPIENIYMQSHKIEQMFIIGDKREFVTAIIVPKEDELKKFFGLNDAFFAENDPITADEKIKAWLEEDVKKLSGSLAKFERIKDFIIKRKPFSVEENELTVSLKQKRKVIEEKYKNWIERMYAQI
ncbi:MAG: long-chain fatty acid--CoA ligase [Bacteroidia bacterium]|nr:long-chain fatty acid--CoA ligase [Bacteroidia bacterium]